VCLSFHFFHSFIHSLLAAKYYDSGCPEAIQDDKLSANILNSTAGKNLGFLEIFLGFYVLGF